MEPPLPRQRKQWAFGNEKATLADIAGAGVSPERDPWPLPHPLLGAHEHLSNRATRSAGSSKTEGLFSDRRTSAEPLLDGRRPSEKRGPEEGFREREQGFNLQLSGANEERVRAQMRRQGGCRKSSAPGGGSEEERRRRRNWQRAQQLVIRTDDGAALPIEEGRGGWKTRKGLEEGDNSVENRGESKVGKEGLQKGERGAAEGETGLKTEGKLEGKVSEGDGVDVGNRESFVKIEKGKAEDAGPESVGRSGVLVERGECSAREAEAFRGQEEEAEFPVVQEEDAVLPLGGSRRSTDFATGAPPLEEDADQDEASRRLSLTPGTSNSYEVEEFEAYEDSFEEDLSLEDASGECEQAQCESAPPGQRAGTSVPAQESTTSDPILLPSSLVLQSPRCAPVPPSESVESPDLVKRIDPKGLRFGSDNPFLGAAIDGSRLDGTVSSSVTYSSVQDLETVRSEVFDAMEVVDVSSEGLPSSAAGFGGFTASTGAFRQEHRARGKQELEVEEIEEETIGSADSVAVELENSIIEEQTLSASSLDRLLERSAKPVPKPAAKPGGFGPDQTVRPLSALSTPKRMELLPRAPLTARDRSKPEAEVNLVLEAVKRENARALEAQKERMARADRPKEREGRKSETAASEIRESGLGRHSHAKEGKAVAQNVDAFGSDSVRMAARGVGEAKPVSPQLSENQNLDAFASDGVRMAAKGGRRDEVAEPIIPELSEKLRLLDTHKQQYLLEVIQKLERGPLPAGKPVAPGDRSSQTVAGKFDAFCFKELGLSNSSEGTLPTKRSSETDPCLPPGNFADIFLENQSEASV
jgi:hypothetical protein